MYFWLLNWNIYWIVWIEFWETNIESNIELNQLSAKFKHWIESDRVSIRAIPGTLTHTKRPDRVKMTPQKAKEWKKWDNFLGPKLLIWTQTFSECSQQTRMIQKRTYFAFFCWALGPLRTHVQYINECVQKRCWRCYTSISDGIIRERSSVVFDISLRHIDYRYMDTFWKSISKGHLWKYRYYMHWKNKTNFEENLKKIFL